MLYEMALLHIIYQVRYLSTCASSVAGMSEIVHAMFHVLLSGKYIYIYTQHNTDMK